MAIRAHSTTRWFFDTLTTNLATATTLAAATRHDFAAKTIYIPEAAAGAITFLSAEVEVSARGQFAVNVRGISGVRIGIKFGAGAFNDQDYTPTAIASTSRSYSFRCKRDVTDRFTAEWSGTSMAVQVGVAFATQADAQAVTNVTASILLTYAYEDGAATYIKTVAVPIQSQSGPLSAVGQVLGNDGANPGGAQQIPALDTFLPEDGKTIRQVSLQFVGNDGRPNATTTDFAFQYGFDGGALTTGATLEAALNGAAWFNYIVDITGLLTTADAHSVEVAGTETTRFPCVGAILYVTYEYDPASATILNSLWVPIAGDTSGFWVGSTATADADRYRLKLLVPEPDPITIVQSGVLLFAGLQAAASLPLVVKAGSQTERTYTFPAISNYSGQGWVVHRTDQDTGWTLARGRNTLDLDVYSTADERLSIFGGVAIINYTSGRASAGPGAHNVSSAWARWDYPTSGAVLTTREIAAATQKFPSFGAGVSHWYLNHIGVERFSYTGGVSVLTVHQEEIGAAELDGQGWLTKTKAAILPQGNLGQYDSTFDLTDYFNQTDQASGKMDPTASRKARAGATAYATTGIYSGARWWTTVHSTLFTVTGTLSGYAGDGSGITVQVWNEDTGELVSSAVSAVGGGYEAVTYDNVDTYFAEGQEDGTHLGRSVSLTPTPA